MNTIDLHTHSRFSLDGEKTVDELIDIAENSSIKTIAIADHNTTEAYRNKFKAHEVGIIPAIELDCSFQGKGFHLLGYGIDPAADVFKKIAKDVTAMEKAGGEYRIDYLQEQMGIKLDMGRLKELRPNGVYEAETLCEVALMQPENDDNPYLKEFRPGGKHGKQPFVDFFWEYCAEGKLAYYPMEFMAMETAIEIYRKQNAMIVLAHPGNNVKEDNGLLDAIIALGIDGLEVYSSYHNDEQIKYYHEAAKKHGLIMTCGSDFHGKSKPDVVMGNCNMPIIEEHTLGSVLKKLPRL